MNYQLISVSFAQSNLALISSTDYVSNAASMLRVSEAIKDDISCIESKSGLSASKVFINNNITSNYSKIGNFEKVGKNIASANWGCGEFCQFINFSCRALGGDPYRCFLDMLECLANCYPISPNQE